MNIRSSSGLYSFRRLIHRVLIDRLWRLGVGVFALSIAISIVSPNALGQLPSGVCANNPNGQPYSSCGSFMCSGLACAYPAPTSNSPAEAVSRALFSGTGITFNQTYGCPFVSGPTGGGVRYCDVSASCTSASRFTTSLVNSLILFESNYSSPLVITGGSECGHMDISSTCVHATGCRVDLIDATSPGSVSKLSAFIKNNFLPMVTGCDNNNGLNYGIPVSAGGPCFTNEGNHWDVAFPGYSGANLSITFTGTGAGTVTNAAPGMPLACATGAPCSYLLTQGMMLNLTAKPAAGTAVFVGWSGDYSSPDQTLQLLSLGANTKLTAEFSGPPDNSGNWTWDPTANGGKGGWVWTGPIPPPPDNSGNWTWDPTRGAWVWTGPGSPPPGGNPPPSGCWHWDATSGAWVYDLCGGGTPPPVSGPPIQIITSGDPNDKVGNTGVGPAQYVAGGQPTNYSIYFDNIPTATAPAQKVVVIDQLDSSLVDLSTVSLGKISFVSKLITPPTTPLSTIGTYSTNVDLRPAQNLIVNIVAAFNQSTGVLTWTYTSLDPSTMQATTDPLAGFLPPGTEGSVSFSVTPKAAATGTQITNQATVVFDVNPPINTPTWLNTIDSTRPVSKVSALPTPQLSPSFSVQWSGTDVGAGIQDYTVYASDNGSAFTAWLTNTAATQSNYIGTAGHTYRFYSIARDLVGNIEAAKTLAEATAAVTTATTIPSAQISTIASGLAYSRVSLTFNGTVTVKNISAATIAGPFEIVFSALPSGVTLANATGTIGGLPYLTLPGASLAPGQSATVNVQFRNPSNVQINFTPVIYSGSF